MDDFDWYTKNKHAGNPAPFDSEKRDAYLRIAELEAQLADANEMLEKCNSKFIVALEAEVKMLRKDAERYWCLRDNCNFAITQNIGHDWINLIFADEVDAAIDAAREAK